jgi:hypothetical protein
VAGCQREMLAGGIFVLPYLIERIKGGDETLVPLVAELTADRALVLDPSAPATVDGPPGLKYRLEKSATGSECLNWWARNRARWAIDWADLQQKPKQP